MRLGRRPDPAGRDHPDRRAHPGHRARRGRHPAGASGRGLRSGELGQDHPHPPHHRRGPAQGRGGRLHRRRARPRPPVRRPDRGSHRGAAGLPAGHRRAGARDRRGAGAQRRGGRGGHRLGGGPGAQGGDRRRDGRQSRRPPGPAHVPGDAQADRRHQPVQHLGHLHQPAPREGRRDVRQPRGDHRRTRPQVLRLGAAGHPQDRHHQGRGSTRWAAGSGQGGQEQGRSARSATREFDILYNEGISYAGSVLDMAVDARIIEKSGAWFSYGDLRLGQGRENVRDFLKQNPRCSRRSPPRCGSTPCATPVPGRRRAHRQLRSPFGSP